MPVTVLSQFPRGECSMAVVGEAPGLDEVRVGEPFVGKSGGLLNRMLKDAGVQRSNCLVTNVFRQRPRDNNVDNFFMKKVQAKKEKWDAACPFPPFGAHGYVVPDKIGEITRLREELEQVKPNLVLGLGVTALWALTGRDKIGSFRGYVVPSTMLPGTKVLCTYHPAYVLRVWSSLPTVMSDIKKASNNAESKEFKVESREIWIEPSIQDIRTFKTKYIDPIRGVKGILSFDIETDSDKQITCIGMAPDGYHAIVIPIWNTAKPDLRYWSVDQEREVWEIVAAILEDKSTRKVAHNGMYDVQYLLRWGIKVRGIVEDTMLIHHVLQPELYKSLEYLASLYTNEPHWKSMVSFSATKNKDGA